jgi:ubiquinone/menaquinone biosynthesis C-methylase UbiE
MDPRLQRRVQRYGWDKASTEYERYWREQLEPAQSALLALAALAPGMRVLDVACGTGLVTFPAAAAVGGAGRVVGTDLSQEMVNRATNEAQARGITNATFERMDAEELQIDGGAFDVVLCSLGLMYVPDPLKAMAEMYRVLAAGGRAVVAVWGERRRCGWAEIFPIVDRRVASEVCPMFFQLGTGDMLEKALQGAGFTDLKSERLDATIDYASAEAACGAAFAGGPVALAYSRCDARARDGAHAEYLASLEPYRRGDGFLVPGEFVIACGRKPS